MHSGITILLRNLSASIRKRGFVATLRLAIPELLFDLRFRTDTMGAANPEEHGHEVDARSHSGYQGINIPTFEMAMRAVEFEGRRTFLDYGSGKGRALLVAARYDLDRIIGVEISGDLCEVARKNFERFCGGIYKDKVEVLEMDACAYQPPGDTDVFFFFNPFGPEIIRQVLEQILISKGEGTGYIIYMNPVFREVFDAAPGLTLLREIILGKKYVEATIYRIN